MSSSFFLIILLAIASFAYMQGKRRAFSLSGGRLCGSRSLHSRPGYYGMLTAVWCVLPALLVFGVWMVLSDTILTALALKTLPASMHNLSADQSNLLVNDLRNLVAGHVAARDIDPVLQQAAVQYQGMERIGRVALGVVMFSIALLSASLVYMRIRPEMRARNHVERIVQVGLVLCSTIAILTTLGIVLSVLFESIRFFQQVPVTDFLFGTKWSPQMAMRADQAGSSGSFGAVPVLSGTFMISGIALTVAVPIGLMSAIYLSEYANSRVRAWAKPVMEILAGVPTVVYGFFAALVVAPFVRNSGEMLGLNV